MGVRTAVFLIALFCTMMSGCSFIYNFRTINGSQGTANISYRLLSGDEIFLIQPVIEKGNVIDSVRASYVDNIVQLELYPGETVTIAPGMNTTLKDIKKRKDGYNAEQVNLEWLKVVHKGKTKEYTLDNIEKAFATNKIALSEIKLR